jgi:hypothetical protein
VQRNIGHGKGVGAFNKYPASYGWMYFHTKILYVPKILLELQAQTYDPEGEYVVYWLPQLRALPNDKRNFPGKSYIEQVVPLKFNSVGKHHGQSMGLGARKTGFGGRQTRGRGR